MSRAAGDALDAAEQRDDGPSDERRLTRNETVFWYGLAGVTYVGASLLEKGLLNWFAGPLWLVAVVWFGPALTDRVAAWRDARRARRR